MRRKQSKRGVLTFYGALFLVRIATAQNTPVAPAPGDSVVLTVEGKVETVRAGSLAWLPARTNEVLHVGDRLRTGLRSRATVQLSNLTVLRINELTTLQIQPPSQPGKQSGVNLEKGAAYFFSRERPTETEFRTPLASGAIRGTEFNLAVAEDGRTVVTLLDGAVALNNSFGSVELASGEQGIVEPGKPPARTAAINAINVIQWVLYYPAVVDTDELNFSEADKQALAASLSAYRSGELLVALANYPTNRAPVSDAEKIYFAQLLLSVGQVEQSTTELGSIQSPPADALREIVAAVKFQPRPATRNPERATASVLLADSYYYQSRAQLDLALSTARTATQKSPNFGFAWERLAELEFSFGHREASKAALRRALELSPRNAQAFALSGFLLVAEGRNQAAVQAFNNAIAIDAALGNAWLGRGLTFIHINRDKDGLRDLLVAASLEPQRSLLRSYLGKAFAQTRDDSRAARELRLAMRLDSSDPTPWLYAALLEQSQNKINDAVSSLEESIRLNDNRAVFRSQLLLDKDRAVRSANLASVYNDNGMTDVGLREAVKAVNDDYANYSAHLFLANTYFNLLDPTGINLRFETPYVSEYLVANLLAPVGSGTLSQQVSQQEYSKLFEQNGVGVASSTEYTSHGDWYQSAAQYGTFGKTEFAFDQNYSSIHLYRANSDQEDFLYDFRIKQQLTPQDTAYAELDFRNTTGGNLAQYYYQSNAASSPFRFKDEQTPIVVAGYHHEWSPGVDTLVLFSHLNDTYSVTNPALQSFVANIATPSGAINSISAPFLTTQNYRSTLDIYSVEAQQIFQTHEWTTVAGARFQDGDFNTKNFEQTSDFTALLNGLSGTIADQNVSAHFERENAYGYEQWQPCDSLRLIGGLAYDRLVIPEDFRYAPLSASSETHYHVLPKAGFIWTPANNTTLRAGYAQSVGGASIDQSFQLEPTQVAGFNQAFRSLIPESIAGANAGPTFTIYGVSLEQKLPTRTYLAVEGDIRQSSVRRRDGIFEQFTNVTTALLEKLDYTEESITFSAHQLVGHNWVLGCVYSADHVQLDDRFPGISDTVTRRNGFANRESRSGTLQTLDLQTVYQNPCGFFAQLDGYWAHQDNGGFDSTLPGDDFWQFNVLSGWRFFHRRAELSVGILNLTGQDYHLNPLNLYPEVPRDRTFFTQLKFLF